MQFTTINHRKLTFPVEVVEAAEDEGEVAPPLQFMHFLEAELWSVVLLVRILAFSIWRLRKFKGWLWSSSESCDLEEQFRQDKMASEAVEAASSSVGEGCSLIGGDLFENIKEWVELFRPPHLLLVGLRFDLEVGSLCIC